MRRFFADSMDISDGKLIIRGEEAAHMIHAVRMIPGDMFIAIDGSGIDYTCRITSADKTVKADIIGQEPNIAEPAVRITLYQAYPKLAKMQEIVQKAVELGAFGIVPFISSRCVKRPKSSDTDRLGRVAVSAVKQCGRAVMPEVSDILSFDDACARMRRHDRLIVCWEEEKEMPLSRALESDANDIGVVIGSEGGFEADEVGRMTQIGGVSVTIGPRILRTETAGIAVLSAIFYGKGQMQY
jgi:16S rRNA (uracil1498-N3)-methyltransferase